MLTMRLMNGPLMLSLVVSLCGCSGLGRIGRQDYTAIAADPFLDRDSDFDSRDSATVSIDDGRVRLNDILNDADTAVATVRDTTGSGPSLSDFMHTKTGSVPEAAPPPSAMATLASATTDEFIEWANQQNTSVRQTSGAIEKNTRNTVQTADHQIRQTVSQVRSEMARFPNTAVGELKAAGDSFDKEVAVPLIEAAGKRTSPLVSSIADEDPFAEIERARQRSTPRTSTMKADTAGHQQEGSRTKPATTSGHVRRKGEPEFIRDSGWRPSHLEFP